jgi:hypothetical protein
MGRVLRGKAFFLGGAGSIFERRLYFHGGFSVEIVGVRSLICFFGGGLVNQK